MAFDRKEYDQLIEKKREERANGTPLPEFYAQAALKAEHLTGDETWDWFLSFVQADIEKMQASVEGERSKLDSPLLVDPNEIQQIRIAIFQGEAIIAAWKAVIELPKDIKEKGEEAKKLLERLPSDLSPQ